MVAKPISYIPFSPNLESLKLRLSFECHISKLRLLGQICYGDTSRISLNYWHRWPECEWVRLSRRDHSEVFAHICLTTLPSFLETGFLHQLPWKRRLSWGRVDMRATGWTNHHFALCYSWLKIFHKIVSIKSATNSIEEKYSLNGNFAKQGNAAHVIICCPRNTLLKWYLFRNISTLKMYSKCFR